MATILVVDDSPVVVASLKAALTQEGFEVLTAADGVEAVQQASARQPDLIVLDVVMPRMNGYQTCRLLKAEAATKHIPVIFLTTQSAKHQVFWGAQAGGAGYLVKGGATDGSSAHVSKEQGWQSILETVKRHLDSRTAPRPPAPTVRQTGSAATGPGTTVDVLTRLNTLLDQQLFESTLINQIATAPAQLSDYRAVIRDLFTTLGGVIDFDVIGLIVFGARQGYCTIGSASSLPPAAVERYRAHLLERLAEQATARAPRAPLVTETVSLLLERAPAPSETISSSGALWRSWAVLPLRSQGVVIGLVTLARHRLEPFGAEVDRMLEAAAQSFTTVVENARLHRELGELSATVQDRAKRLALLFALSGRLLGARRLPALFTEILRICFQAIDADSGSVMLLEPHRQLRVVASVGLKRRFARGLRLMVGERVAGWVAKHRQPQLLVGALAPHGRFAHVQGRTEVKSSLVIPMLVKRKLIGVLNLNRTASDAVFTKEDIELVSTLANQAALAVQQMQLYQKLETSFAEVRQIKSQLIQSEKLAALGRLASAMAHEIDNPLTVISGTAQLLMDDVRRHPDQVASLQRIVDQSDRASDIIERLLHFAKPAPSQLAPVNLNAVVQEALFLVQRQLAYDKIDVQTQLDAAVPPVLGSANQLQEICLNLMLNAYQAMGHDGTLTIATEHQPKTRHIVLRVSDTGPGIPPDAQPHVFEPFFTTKEEGKGLGLFVAHQIVLQHRGSIRLTSRPGNGTTFLITLPVAPTTAPPHPDSLGVGAAGTLRKSSTGGKARA